MACLRIICCSASILLAGCASAPPALDAVHSLRSESPLRSTTPATPRDKDKGNAPTTVTLPIGAGLSGSPTTFILGGSLDIPLDSNLTFGPSIQLGTDSDVDLQSLSLQLKYFLPRIGKDDGGFALLPYLSAGVGYVRIDKSGRSPDDGAMFHFGGGLRYLTGEEFRVGSEIRVNTMFDSVAGESAYVTFELLQVVLAF